MALFVQRNGATTILLLLLSESPSVFVVVLQNVNKLFLRWPTDCGASRSV